MKVIFLKKYLDNNPGDIKEVKNGHALNYLIPQGVAQPATAENIDNWKQLKNKKTKQTKQEQSKKNDIIEWLGSNSLTLSMKANDQGHLYAAVQDKDIISAIEKQLNKKINSIKFKLLDNVKQIGEHKVKVKINNDKVELKLKINATKK